MSKKLIAFLSVLSLSISLPLIPVNAAVKAGASCKTLGLTSVASGKTYTCVKSGKKLVWRKIKSTSAAIPSDFLSYKNAMVYGVSGSDLIRRSDSGSFFDSDSRQVEYFSEIRSRAFAELNPRLTNSEHPNVEIVFDITESFPSKIADLFRSEINAAAAFWNDYFADKVKVYVSLVTEKDRDYIKQNPYMRRNLPQIFDRFDSKNERPFVTGGGAFWHFEREWSGHIFLGTASWVDLSYINYEWPQVARHEFVHVVQDYAFAKNYKSLGLSQRPQERWDVFHRVQPLHFREGSANTISYLTSFRHLGWSSDALDWLMWIRTKNAQSAFKITSTKDIVSILREMECIHQCRPVSSKNPEQAFEYSYALGALLYEWVIGTYGLDGYKRILDQLMIAQTFDEVIQQALGLSKESLYEKSAPYILDVLLRLG